MSKQLHGLFDYKPVKKEPETDSEHPEAQEPEDKVDCEHQELEEGEAASV